MATAPNKFPGRCIACGTTVPAGAGTRARTESGWVVQHNVCAPIAAPTTVAPSFAPTEEQEQALKLFATGENLVIEAGAGTGKTSTLRLLAEDAQADGRVGIYIAFNKAIVVEAGAKFPSNITCTTAHSLAYRALGYKFKARLGGPRVRPIDVANALGIEPFRVADRELSRSFLGSLVLRTISEFCRTADATIARSHVPYVDGLDTPNDDGTRSYGHNRLLGLEILPYVERAWADLQGTEGQLPFSHDIYLKLFQLSQPTLRADFILFDEAQDANPVILDIVGRQTCQLVYVGDSNQQIYEFTGAVNALGRVRDAGAACTYLSTSFRFGAPIAQVANVVLDRLGAELRLSGAAAAGSIGPIAQPDAYLTRTNAAAVTKVLEEQAAGRKAHLVGGGKQVVSFSRAALTLQAGGRPTHPDLACFETWADVEEYVKDDAGSDLRLLVGLVGRFGGVVIVESLSHLPAESEADIVVSTAHKAKGREWAGVALAGDFVPQPDKDGKVRPLTAQEQRLLYVSVTRARIDLDLTAVASLFPAPVEEPEVD